MQYCTAARRPGTRRMISLYQGPGTRATGDVRNTRTVKEKNKCFGELTLLYVM